MSSAGAVLTKTVGTLPEAPGSDATTSAQLSSFGSFEKLAGSVPAADHGPVMLAAFNQIFS